MTNGARSGFAPPLTTIIATIGPACANADTVAALITAGASIFRLNFSHGDLDAHAEHLATIRRVAAAANEPVAVLGDLPGPKLRVAPFETGSVEVRQGSTVTFHRDGSATAASARKAAAAAAARETGPVLSCTSPILFEEAAEGHNLYVDDGAVRMQVVAVTDSAVTCRVTDGGVISSGKGINLPDSDRHGVALTDRDRECVEWAVEHEIDFLALSFVGSADDIRGLRAAIGEAGSRRGSPGVRIPIVAKIERPTAVGNVESIADAADAIMVARGDLGVEIDLARVPVVQKQLIAAAHAAGKPCIVATQMLQSMIEKPRPTRAEASDVATAIFDRVDAVMLSGETAVGRDPARAVTTMRRIAEETEAHLSVLPEAGAPPALLQSLRNPVAALAHGAWTIARDAGVRLIAVWSQEGGGARYLSRNLFQIPVVAASTDVRALRRMQILRGVLPVHMEKPHDIADFIRRIDERLTRVGWARPGDTVLVMAGEPIGTPRVTNSVILHRIGIGGLGR